MKKRKLLLLLLFALVAPSAFGQGADMQGEGGFPADSGTTTSVPRQSLGGPKVAVKTNLLYWGAATPNLGVDVALGRRTTLDISGSWNPFTWSDNRKWKHWLVQPGVRFWTCERFNGHFFGVHLHSGVFNVGGVGPFTALSNHRYEGWFYGAGVSYGHQWILGNRWAFEAEIGAGYARMEYDKFGCAECAPKTKSGHYNYFGPTKAAVTLVFNLW